MWWRLIRPNAQFIAVNLALFFHHLLLFYNNLDNLSSQHFKRLNQLLIIIGLSLSIITSPHMFSKKPKTAATFDVSKTISLLAL